MTASPPDLPARIVFTFVCVNVYTAWRRTGPRRSTSSMSQSPVSVTDEPAASRAARQWFEVRLVGIRYAARDTNLFDFERIDGRALPEATPGAHITIALPNGLERQYSLVLCGERSQRYTVGVKLDPASRGGSRYMHESLRVGSELCVSGPLNNFPLSPDPAPAVFIAGGIGITPIYSMVHERIRRRLPWSLHYACRSRADAAFLQELGRYREVHLHFDEEQAGRVLDIAAIVAAQPREAHLYCCGPAPMLAAFEAVTGGRPPERVHVEYFTARHEAATEGGFVVELARSGREFLVPPGRTILQVLREAGIDVPSSCEEGVCSACETRVISGVPDHRDSVLSPDERAANRTMMICCSGCKGDRLVLDL